MSPRPTPASLKPRKSPAQSRSAATVDAIVEAAARILETDGFPGYTTNAVARQAGVSVGSLCQYVPGRDAITRALLVLTEPGAGVSALAFAQGTWVLRCGAPSVRVLYIGRVVVS